MIREHRFKCFTIVFCFFQESFPDECDTIFDDLVETDLGAIFHDLVETNLVTIFLVLVEVDQRYHRENMMHNAFFRLVKYH